MLNFLNVRTERSHDELGFVMAAIKRVRKQWFPFLWQEMSTREMMDTARGTAFFVLASSDYQTQRQLYNAVQRELYAEARAWGWRRERNSQQFTSPIPTFNPLPLPLDTGEDTYYH